MARDSKTKKLAAAWCARRSKADAAVATRAPEPGKGQPLRDLVFEGKDGVLLDRKEIMMPQDLAQPTFADFTGVDLEALRQS